MKCLYLSRACGTSQSQHLSLLQVQADLPQHGRHVEIGEEESRIAVHVAVLLVFVLAPNLVKQLPDTLVKGNIENARPLSSVVNSLSKTPKMLRDVLIEYTHTTLIQGIVATQTNTSVYLRSLHRE